MFFNRDTSQSREHPIQIILAKQNLIESMMISFHFPVNKYLNAHQNSRYSIDINL